MLQTIQKEGKLKKYLYHEIEDAGISVSVDARLSEDEYIGIKIDDYYMGLRQKITPKAVDFIVTVDCECDWYTLYILEFKNVSRPPTTREIHEKFDTAINDFMSNEFKEIFLSDKVKYREIFLYLVTTAYQKAVEMGSFDQYRKLRNKMKQRDSLWVDDALSGRLYRFRGKVYRIQREVPPNPVIRRVL